MICTNLNMIVTEHNDKINNLVGDNICPHVQMCIIRMCELQMCFLHIPLRHPRRVGSWPGSAIINADPGAIRVKCLAQGHVDRFVTLSAQGFKLLAFQLMAQRSNT